MTDLAALFTTEHESLRRYIWSRTHMPELVDEISGTVWARTAAAVLCRGETLVNPRAYVYRSAHNTIIDHYRAATRRTFESYDDLRLPMPDVLHANLEHRIFREFAFGILTPAQAEVIRMRYFEGYDNEAIAAELGRSIGQVKSLIFRGLRSLAQRMNGEML